MKGLISARQGWGAIGLMSGLVWAALWFPAGVHAGEKQFLHEPSGIRFVYPERFSLGKFKSQAYPEELIEKGFDIPFSNAVVLVEPGRLRGTPPEAVSVGEIPALWLEVRQGPFAEFLKKKFFLEPYRIDIGGRTVFRLPGFPGPYGDQAFYYLTPLSGGRVLELTAHRYYFRSPKINPGDAHPPGTGYDRVLESILQTLAETRSPQAP